MSSGVYRNPYRDTAAAERGAPESNGQPDYLAAENLARFHYELPVGPVPASTASAAACPHCARLAMVIAELRERATKD